MPLTTPTALASRIPTGRHMDDGYQTLVIFSGNPSGANPTLSVWEKSVKPMGYDGGADIPTSTMLNISLLTKAPRKLIGNTNLRIRAAWDPRVHGQLQTLINVNQQIDNYLPDGSCISFFGWLMKAEPNDNVEGSQPEMELDICVSNTDPSTGAETSPIRHPLGGTGTT